ncbi:MAG: ectoine hydroxylase-related dioxygenase (phytanoyl-CoA dioxygenase family) [Rhodothermales bacterium]|jgi:ectoine hydroxylase-related dioxygenase (phytanoyl-CoA dioxygenase family)
MATPLEHRKQSYLRDGFINGVRILSASETASHYEALERAESRVGPLHYKTKVHTILKSPFELATLPGVLDIVEGLIGPDILLYNVTYIIKEPNTPSHVSWHQDLTYWGLSHDDQVSMWLALSPATPQNGCMRMIPGSHALGRQDHHMTADETNVLFSGQTVRGVDESNAISCPLEPGEASFHHGWTLHSSMPNISNERRIGLNVQYFATHVSQTKHEMDTALLVRGQDHFKHFEPNIPAVSDLDPEALKYQEQLELRYRAIAGTN